jgi:hypothetical protein
MHSSTGLNQGSRRSGSRMNESALTSASNSSRGIRLPACEGTRRGLQESFDEIRPPRVTRSPNGGNTHRLKRRAPRASEQPRAGSQGRQAATKPRRSMVAGRISRASGPDGGEHVGHGAHAARSPYIFIRHLHTRTRRQPIQRLFMSWSSRLSRRRSAVGKSVTSAACEIPAPGWGVSPAGASSGALDGRLGGLG